MKFLFMQIAIVVLVCILIAALSNLTELGLSGWIIAGATGYGLFRIYRHTHLSLKSSEQKDPRTKPGPESPNFSRQIQEFMFGDATGVKDD